MEFNIHAVGFNTEPLQGWHTVKAYGIGIYVSGLISGSSFFPNGRPRRKQIVSGKPQPMLRLYFPGGKCFYSYSQIRENWWVALEEPCPFYYDFAKNAAICVYRGAKFEIPAEIPLEAAEVPAIRMAFSEILEKYTSGLPRERLEAELILQNIFLRFISAAVTPVDDEHDIAGRLKRLIDEDRDFNYSLAELSTAAGVSRETARQCFFRRYQVNPREYRNRQRIGKVMNLITSTELSIKEIAFRCGFRNASHLTSIARKYLDATPSELRRKYRRITR